MKFKYVAYDKSRQKVKGVGDYEDRRDALAQLKLLNYRVTKLELVQESKVSTVTKHVASTLKANLQTKFGGKQRKKQFESFREELDFLGYDTSKELKNIVPSEFDIHKYKERYELADIQVEKILSGRLNSRELVTTEMKKTLNLESLNPFGRISLKDLIIFTEHLAILLDTNVVLIEALETIQEDMASVQFKRVIDKILYDLNKGNEFSAALAKHPKLFSPLYIAMVQVGETTGSALPSTLRDLCAFLEMNLRLKRQFLLAMIYPISVLAVLVALLFFVSKFVMPRLMTLFNGDRFELPTLTKIVFGIAENIGVIFAIILGAVLLLTVIILRVTLIRTLLSRMIDSLSLKIPYVKNLVITRFMYQISLTLSITLRGGISITDALNLTHNSIGNRKLKGEINDVYYGLEKGRSVAEVFREQPHFENLLKRAVAAGDKSGMLSETLSNIANYYDGELTNRIETLVQVLVPVTIVLLALIIAPFIIGIYLPIVSLTQQVGKM